ncbi:hypothetical protein Q7C36_016899 [Tachysurus vachellii]|uniref:Uncharacterized protein n=1 Tax=Tachysurus vachellii TaxID=175792 RepID=A0AA88MAC8_TACVA|nr:hypothetical protein Q7C36_016899 [Tachysurus vachellii]
MKEVKLHFHNHNSPELHDTQQTRRTGGFSHRGDRSRRVAPPLGPNGFVSNVTAETATTPHLRTPLPHPPPPHPSILLCAEDNKRLHVQPKSHSRYGSCSVANVTVSSI